MAQVLVRDLEDTVVEKLKERARSQGRSLESELRQILQQAAEERQTPPNFSITELQAMFAGRRFTDSGKLQREDRER
ncbi:MAG: Arc family DNA-binding protein [Armatimonadota bacterium]|nr:Arc family DNA-binding protein [Armatimonadota bacterium]